MNDSYRRVIAVCHQIDVGPCAQDSVCIVEHRVYRMCCRTIPSLYRSDCRARRVLPPFFRNYTSWIKIIEAALGGTPDQVVLNWHPAFSRPAAMRYTASNPELHAWLNKWNSGKPYHEQVRPFGFLVSFTPRTGIFAPITLDSVVESSERGRPRKHKLAPIAPFNKVNPASKEGLNNRRDFGPAAHNTEKTALLMRIQPASRSS